MHLAIVNIATGLVENIAVPPQEGAEYSPPEGFEAVLTAVANIGDTYAGGEFIPPTPPIEPA